MRQITALPVFAGLSPGEMALLGPIVQPYDCPSGEAVFAQGDAASHLYLIVSGRAELRYKPHDGPAITLTHLGAGDVFGWSAVTRAASYTASVVAESPLEALRVPGFALRELCSTHPDLGRLILSRLSALVSQRWQDAGNQVERILAQALQTSPDLDPPAS